MSTAPGEVHYEMAAMNERAGHTIDDSATALDGAPGWDMGLAVAILERDDGRI